MNVAIYTRRSTNEELQHDSLRVQEAVLRGYAERHRFSVVRVYSDSASGVTTNKRDAFKQLVADIIDGADFELILVRDISRFGRFQDADEGGYWETLFRLHGVSVLYCEEPFEHETAPSMKALTKSLKRVMAAEYSRERSRVVTYSQARVVRLGMMHGGPPPYAMRRILVSSDGEFIADLKKGDWKALSNHRVKLVPAGQAEVSVVRRIFSDYAAGLTLKQIASSLNKRKVPSPQLGKRWYENIVAYILDNVRYNGASHYRPTSKRFTGAAASSQEAVLTKDAYPKIIDDDLWAKVQARRNEQTRRVSNDVMADQLRSGLSTQGFVSRRMIPLDGICWETYKNRFGTIQAGLRQAYASEIKDIYRQITTHLELSFDSVRPSDGGVTINGHFEVPFIVSFPQQRSRGVVFPFDLSECASGMCIAVGLHPDGSTFRIFVIRTLPKSSAHRRTVAVNVKRTSRYEAADMTDVPPRIQKLLRSSYGVNERRFMEHCASAQLLNLAEAAKILRLPRSTVGHIYRRLHRAGVTLPSLKYVAGRRITVTCSKCGKARRMAPSDALALRQDTCFECMRNRDSHRVPVTCPDCASVRLVWPSVRSKLSGGERTPCKKCTAHRARICRTRDEDSTTSPP